MKKRAIIVTAILALFVLHTNAQQEITGLWKNNEQDYILRLSQVGNSLAGRIVWLGEEQKTDGKPVLDVNNPDEKLRRLPLKGNKILEGLSYDNASKTWTGGNYYDFNQGKYYKCKLVNRNGVLELSFENSDKRKITLTKAD